MEDATKQFLPFITRDMLQQGLGTTFQLQVTVNARGSQEIRVRGITQTGRFSHSINPVGSKAEELFLFGLPELPIWLTVDGPGVDFALDQAYVKVDLVVNGDRVHTLCSGYVNNVQTISFPNSIPRNQFDGRGLIALTTDTDPAVNTEVTITVPTDEIWLVRSLKLTLVTDANAANRYVKLTVASGSTTIAHLPTAAVQVASKTVIYTWAPGLTLTNDANNLIQTSPFPPDMMLIAGDTIKTVTLNLQATDNWGLPVIYAEKWLVPYTP